MVPIYAVRLASIALLFGAIAFTTGSSLTLVVSEIRPAFAHVIMISGLSVVLISLLGLIATGDHTVSLARRLCHLHNFFIVWLVLVQVSFCITAYSFEQSLVRLVEVRAKEQWDVDVKHAFEYIKGKVLFVCMMCLGLITLEFTSLLCVLWWVRSLFKEEVLLRMVHGARARSTRVWSGSRTKRKPGGSTYIQLEDIEKAEEVDIVELTQYTRQTSLKQQILAGLDAG